ncbi:UDP-N-acetylglucosamine 2-epimerase (non-hydrolyzing) [Geoalkalibacter halelectricus]|uniref:UDP-N-acetylglucosamine 2-epimerase (Non-hydrolyzing) n=2 Tax=Geoalkalibacter halelectricus TaxID=2847045 RepID=A0ABY5ZMA5_9BACT|nr:UDP-N-acetylglucosamine 2-epimerase (non-hydrolyzing) [Geoalkalibacter halelectricus]UWZ79604.1 UDP-N-acetylglucosamine 2-epimerase (non-hydrolyzing) [Geoalkalibacter halelectricus]
MKVAPIIDELKRRDIDYVLVHTGQHYDEKMSKLFFVDLGMPKPHVDLEVGSGSHARQTGEVLMRIEPILESEKPDVVIVVGDVNSTLAATLAAAKLCIPVAHVEAGLRSFDRTMPEEINRLMTDSVADFLFTTEELASEHLRREGIPDEKIFFVGNTMIDSLVKHVRRADESPILEQLGVTPKNYGVVTLHRPSNVDQPESLRDILEALSTIARDLPLVFPIHPRTRKRIAEFGLEALLAQGFILCEPLGYLDFLKLNKDARLVLTDSGGIQEETTVLGVPCITLRHNTERPITVTAGTNQLVGSDKHQILSAAAKVLSGQTEKKQIPPLWDGQAAKRIVDFLEQSL